MAAVSWIQTRPPTASRPQVRLEMHMESGGMQLVYGPDKERIASGPFFGFRKFNAFGRLIFLINEKDDRDPLDMGFS